MVTSKWQFQINCPDKKKILMATHWSWSPKVSVGFYIPFHESIKFKRLGTNFLNYIKTHIKKVIFKATNNK